MRFASTRIDGSYTIALEPHHDERGFFARAFCAEEFARHGLAAEVAQVNMSHNVQAGTLRGLHYQVEPAPEAKTVRCLTGAIFDVLVDLRPESETYLDWFGVELRAGDGLALHVPTMCAHGFLTLADDTLVQYLSSAPYTPEAERGLRFDDAAIGIEWPAAVKVISAKDAGWDPISAPQR